MQYLDSALMYLSFLIADMVVSDHALIVNEHVDIVLEDVVDDGGKMMSFYR